MNKNGSRKNKTSNLWAIENCFGMVKRGLTLISDHRHLTIKASLIFLVPSIKVCFILFYILFYIKIPFSTLRLNRFKRKRMLWKKYREAQLAAAAILKRNKKYSWSHSNETSPVLSFLWLFFLLRFISTRNIFCC